MEKFDGTILVTVSFYNIKAFRFEGSTNVRFASEGDADGKMEPLIDKLIQVIGGTGTWPPEGKTPPNQAYRIGDTGPAGGIIFFDRGFAGDGWQYLEAAPAETEFTAQWGAYERDVGTMTAVGFGKQNTKAQICDALDINGYKDWFLPSKDELDLMYKNLKQNGFSRFGKGVYWSSSQYNNSLVWVQRFNDGYQFHNYRKNNTFMVRPIRAF